MKKLLSFTIIIALVLSLTTNFLFVYGEGNTSIYVNSEQISAKYVVNSNQYFLEYKTFLSSLDVNYTYNPKDKSLIITRGKDKLTLKVSSKTAIINGKKTTLSTAPYLYGPELYIPAKFLCDSLKITYIFDQTKNRININYINTAPKLVLNDIIKNSNAIVLIKVYNEKHELLGTGSGFIISADGTVVTNYHVIDKARFCEIVTSDNSVYLASRVRAYDIALDLAILKIDYAQNMPFVKLGNSYTALVGDSVVAIGSPLSLQNTVSNGIISGKRVLDEKNYIQTTAPISPGSSGGALFDMYGKVVGITTAVSKNGENITFVIPISDIKSYLTNYSDKSLQEVYAYEHIVEYENGDCYEGDFVNGLKEGLGTYTWANGDKYSGQWVNDYRNGLGLFIWAKDDDELISDMYIGSFENDLMSGYGIYYYSNGDKYEGEWQNGAMNGSGKYYSLGKLVVDGNYKNDLLDGFCSLYDDDFMYFAGNFKEGKMNGPGTAYSEDGRVINGVWENNELVRYTD